MQKQKVAKTLNNDSHFVRIYFVWIATILAKAKSRNDGTKRIFIKFFLLEYCLKILWSDDAKY